MSEVNANLILDGITLALRQAFPNSQIHAEAVKQGLVPPAFVVCLVSGSRASQPSARFFCQSRFDIVGFPKASLGERAECYDAAARLFDVLEVIALPGEPPRKLRGSDMSFHVEDGLLHFLVSYSHSLRRGNENTPMGTLAVQQGGI